MIGKLINRPVAVTMSVIATLILGVVAATLLPVSLMPDVKIPRIVVQAVYPGASAREVNQAIISPLTTQLRQLPHLVDIKGESSLNSGTISLEFSYGTDVDLLFIEVNERIDKMLPSLPKGVERPKVIKAGVSDIPAFFMDISLKENSALTFRDLSRFASEVIAKRAEQIPAVALVDMTGLSKSEILIIPDVTKMEPAGIKISDFEKAVKNSSIKLGNLKIRDEFYEWSIRFKSEIKSVDDIKNIRLNINDRVYLLSDLADVKEQERDAAGVYLSDGKRAVSLAVIKQADARMKDLKADLETLTTELKAEHPELDIKITRDQTELLEYSISNLKSNIIAGALLACLVIFFFMRDFRTPLLISVTIPLSLVVSLLFFFLVGISINVISLSGLILGVGMMVDNSIIVIDNITQNRQRTRTLQEAVVKGVSEVFVPMLSSVLTTCAVFVPLIFLSGISGALFFDQAMGVTIGLFSSLIVAVIVIPVYYYKFCKSVDSAKEMTLFKKMPKVDFENVYEKGLKWTLRHQKSVWLMFAASLPLLVLLYTILPKSKLPEITQNDVVFRIDWNYPIGVEENQSRCQQLLKGISTGVVSKSEVIGNHQFLLSHTPELTTSEALVYAKCDTPASLDQLVSNVKQAIATKYPGAFLTVSPSGNIFNIIFSDYEPKVTVKLIPKNGEIPEPDIINREILKIDSKLEGISTEIEPVNWQETVNYVPDNEKMAFFKVEYSAIAEALKNSLRQNEIYNLRSGNENVPVVTGLDENGKHDLLSSTVTNRDGADIPLGYLLSEGRGRDLKKVYTGNQGGYYPVNLNLSDKEVPDAIERIESLYKGDENFEIAITGSYFSNREMIKELIAVLAVALLLLLFILAAQFESMIQPFIILSEIVVDILGAFVVLWIFGAGINIMSLIGLVVMSGIIINDSILKVDTINRLRRGGHSLIRAIMEGGRMRLKPIIMTSLTTIFALLPFLGRGSLGSDLQYPLSLALIGGMVLGTIVSIFFIPLFYYNIYKNRGKR